MAQIPPIDDAYINEIIKSNGPYNPSLITTQGTKMRELIKLLRDRMEQGDTEAVKTTGDQNISGTKTFTLVQAEGISVNNMDNPSLNTVISPVNGVETKLLNLNEGLFAVQLAASGLSALRSQTLQDKSGVIALTSDVHDDRFNPIAGTGISLNGTYPDITINTTGIDSTPDATTLIRGKVRLSGDLAGNADAPTVPGLALKIDSSQLGIPGGIPTLDSGGKVLTSQLPDGIVGALTYQGIWNAATNTPVLTNPPASSTKGYYYVANTAGTQFGITVAVGDWIVSNGTAWEKVDNSDAVTSVFGRLGNILGNEGDYSSFYPLLSGSYADPSWITSLAYSKLIGAPDLSAYVDLTTDQAVNGVKRFIDTVKLGSDNPALTSGDITSYSGLRLFNPDIDYRTDYSQGYLSFGKGGIVQSISGDWAGVTTNSFLTMPKNKSGVIALASDIPTSTNYIANSNSLQSSSNFNISGIGKMATLHLSAAPVDRSEATAQVLVRNSTTGSIEKIVGDNTSMVRANGTTVNIESAVKTTLLNGLVTGTNTPITSSNTVLTGLANLQAQISGINLDGYLTLSGGTLTGGLTGTTGNFSGNVKATDAVFSGGVTASKFLPNIGGTWTSGQAAVFNSATDGLSLSLPEGSTNDFMMMNVNGEAAMRVGAGVPNVYFDYNVSAGAMYVDNAPDSPTAVLRKADQFVAAFAQPASNYTVVDADYTIMCTSGSSSTVTFPDPTTLPGRTLKVINYGTGTPTITTAAATAVFVATASHVSSPVTSMTIPSSRTTWQCSGGKWWFIGN